LSALDFLMICVGVGIVAIAATFCYRIIIEVRGRNRMFKDVTERIAPEDVEEAAFGNRLRHLQEMRFGRPMAHPTPTNRPLPKRPRSVVVPFKRPGSGPKKDDE